MKYLLFSLVAIYIASAYGNTDIKIAPIPRPDVCKTLKKDILRDLMNKSNENFKIIYQAIRRSKCRLEAKGIKSLEEYRQATNDVIETVDDFNNSKVDVAIKAYDNELIELLRDWREFSDDASLSSSCYNELTEFRREAITLGEYLVIAVVTVQNSRCSKGRKWVRPSRPNRPHRPNRPNWPVFTSN